MDDVQAVLAQPFLGGAGAVALEDRRQLAREQQAGALHVGDQAAQFRLQLLQLLHRFDAALADVLAYLRGQLGQRGAGHVQGARVGGHRVAIHALAVQAGGTLVHGEHRQRVLRGVQRLGVGLHVRRVQAFEAGVVDDGQHAVRAQAGLDRIHQEQAAVAAGQFARGGVERRRHGTARVAFAHHRLQEHGLDEPALGLRIGEGLLQRIHVVRRDGDDRIFAAVAGQVLLVGLARGVRVQRRTLGAAVEAALHHDALDGAAGVAAVRVGHQLAVDVGDACGQADRFGTRVEAQELRERAAATGVADLLAQGAVEAQLRQARGHDVGHHLRAGHRVEHGGRRVAEAQHAVAAGVVQHGAIEGDHPGAARGQCDVRVDRVVGIEVDVAGLHGAQLLGFIQVEQFGELVLQARVLGGGGLDDGGEVRVALGQAFDGGIVQAAGQALARVGAQGGEGVGQGHGVAPEKRGKPLLSGLTRRLTVVICAKFMDISSIRRNEAPHEAHRRRPAAALSAP